MSSVYWKTVLATGLCAVACSQLGLAQAPPVILRIEYDNGVRYVYDTADPSAFATIPTPLSQIRPTFASLVILADIVAVNDKPVHRLSDLTDELERNGVGKTARLSLQRDGRTRRGSHHIVHQRLRGRRCGAPRGADRQRFF